VILLQSVSWASSAHSGPGRTDSTEVPPFTWGVQGPHAAVARPRRRPRHDRMRPAVPGSRNWRLAGTKTVTWTARARRDVQAPAHGLLRGPAAYRFNCEFTAWHPETEGANRSGPER